MKHIDLKDILENRMSKVFNEEFLGLIKDLEEKSSLTERIRMSEFILPITKVVLKCDGFIHTVKEYFKILSDDYNCFTHIDRNKCVIVVEFANKMLNTYTFEMHFKKSNYPIITPNQIKKEYKFYIEYLFFDLFCEGCERNSHPPLLDHQIIYSSELKLEDAIKDLREKVFTNILKECKKLYEYYQK